MHRSRKAPPWAVASAAVAAIVIVIVAYAWIDGGSEPLRPMASAVSPEAPR